MRELGDYKLYAVPEPTTIAARQSKQVLFLGEARVPFTRVYTFTVDEDSIMDDNDFQPRQPIVTLRLQNKQSDGLGKPLPAGVVSVMESGGAGAVLAGQDQIDDIPVGLPVELELGTAMDIWIDPRVTQERTIEMATTTRSASASRSGSATTNPCRSRSNIASRASAKASASCARAARTR